uniref:STAS domain-containing protein n=1 Tax=Strigamia maritima TaxID=126957 RepID=T1J349_STRMM
MSEDESIPGLPKIFRTESGKAPTYEVPARQAYTLNSLRLENDFVDKKPYHFDINEYRPVITKQQIKRYIKARIPILVWLKEYSWKRDFLADIIGGVTLGVLRVPQAMAYAYLAQVKPEYGLYTCFFSCLIYTILGSSRHVSVGTFSVLCLMMGTVVTKYAKKQGLQETDPNYDLKKIQMLTAMCFIVGIMHLVLGLLKLGSLSILMSETLVSGFTTGAAFHVFTSQVPLLLDIKITEGGDFYIFQVYYSVFVKITETNYISALISFIALFLLIFTMNYDIGNFKKKTGLPLPMELTIVIVITIVSHFVKLNEEHKVKIVGSIPKGLPIPNLPDFSIMPGLILDSIPIAIVSYVISFSMALIFAKKYKYRVHANQLASFISCFIILAVLSYIGFLLHDLPQCILGAIVMAAVQGMFFQFKDLIMAWKLSIMDALVWLVSFSSVFIIGTANGLSIGLAFSLLTIILRTINIRAFKIQFTEPQACLIGAIPGTDLYVDISKYQKVKEIPGIRIFRFNGPIHFANRTYFKSRLHDLIDVTTKLAEESRSRRTIADYQEENVSVHLAACQDPVLDMLKHTKFESKAPNSCIFPTIHDAVLYCLMARNASMHY